MKFAPSPLGSIGISVETPPPPLAEREAELLPVPYFHVVFTLPAAIADIAYQNKAVIYDLLFKASADTLTTIAADPSIFSARIGIISVLHTWGSALTHHPHLHMIVPGGGVSLDGARWVSCRPGFFLPVRVLARLFRQLFLKKLLAALEAGRLQFFGNHAPLADAQAPQAGANPNIKGHRLASRNGQQSMAATNKCLAGRNKSRTGVPATKRHDNDLAQIPFRGPMHPAGRND